MARELCPCYATDMRKHIAPLALLALLCVTTITQTQLTLIQCLVGRADTG